MNSPEINLAGCLIFNSQKKLLLLHRQTKTKDQWETPGGKIEPGETSEQAAIREIEEELGVKVQLTRKVGEGRFAEGDQPYHYTWFQAQIISGIPRIAEPQTFSKLQFFSWDEIISLYHQLSAGTQTLVSLHQKKIINL